VTVDGLGSTWTDINAIIVGRDGTGTLGISHGGSVSSYGMTIGDSEGSTGTVTVDGESTNHTPSSLTISGESDTALVVGNYGTGTLTISNGGVVNVSDGSGGITLAAGGGSGTLNIGAPAGSPAAGAGILQALWVSTGVDPGIVQFNTLATDSSPYFFTK